jgi:D-alanyl-lipoteichoic acid acyltransferase DltB (MBOAT superfamily)
MLFNTLQFALFFLITLAVYWSLPGDRWRQPFLLLGSLFFYGYWDWRFVLLLLVVIGSSYGFALAMARAHARGRRSGALLATACAVNLGLLFVFKYCNFFADSLKIAMERFGIDAPWSTLHILLPVGVSFYVFQSLTYLINVHRRKLEADRNFVKIALYISFFPHLVAGPIIHATDFLWQLRETRRWDPTMFLEGTQKFVLGFFMKSVFADNIAVFVDPVYADLGAYDNVSILAASFGFYCQIYFDFAGYSLMAIGITNQLGYWLPDNFNYPYRATSVVDFWRRWHISLSTWLRDYLYISLGGNRGSRLFQYRNLMLTMLLGGLWHGASWNFVLWGGLHGLALVVAHAWRSAHQAMGLRWPIPPVAGIVTAWLATQIFVLLCWIPFRATTFAQTGEALRAVLWLRPDADLTRAAIPWLVLVLPVLVDTFILGRKHGGQPVTNPWLGYATMGVAFLIALLFMFVGTKPFIYFQFQPGLPPIFASRSTA